MNGCNPYNGQFKPLLGMAEMLAVKAQPLPKSSTMRKVNRPQRRVPQHVRSQWVERLKELLIKHELLVASGVHAPMRQRRRMAAERLKFAKKTLGEGHASNYLANICTKGIMPNIEQLQKIAQHFGVKPEELIPKERWQYLGSPSERRQEND